MFGVSLKLTIKVDNGALTTALLINVEEKYTIYNILR